MSSELALNAYILLGNALNHVVNEVSLNYDAELNAPQTTINSLYRAVEPLAPGQILAALVALPAKERYLLDRCCRYCLRTMRDDEVSAKLGLPRHVADDVLNQLALETSHA